MNEVDAIKAVIYALKGSAPFNTTHPLYRLVQFVPSYPLEDLGLPRVGFTPVGGGNQPRGLGTYRRIRRPDYQVDVLAATELEARRILQCVREALLADYEDADRDDEDFGEPGCGYLGQHGIKSVIVGEPSSEVWDEARRVGRVVATLSLRYLED